MAQITYRCNLSAKGFPFLLSEVGRSVIIPGPDQNFSRQSPGVGDGDRDVSIPQAYFLQNALPTPQGYISADFTQIGLGGIGYPYVSMTIASANNRQVYFSITKVPLGPYRLRAFLPSPVSGAFPGNWDSQGVVDVPVGGLDFPTNSFIPHAVVIKNNIYFARRGVTNSLLRMDVSIFPPSATLVAVATTGGFDFDFITACSGYLIGLKGSQVHWSNPANELDFTPSATTGAGTAILAEIRGSIISVVSTPGGFLIYTSQNIIFASFTGNSRFPFAFREVFGSAGIQAPWHVSNDPNTEEHFAWTSAGILRIYRGVAELIFGDVQNFISGNKYPALDPFDGNPKRLYDATPINSESVAVFYRGVALVSKRYLVLSWGASLISRYTHALIYDTSLGRWGSLNFRHEKVFGAEAYFELTERGDTERICFLTNTGDVFAVNTRLNVNPPTNRVNPGLPAIVLGKFQYSRQRLITLQEIQVERVAKATATTPSNAQEVYILPSKDGKNLDLPVFPVTRSTNPVGMRDLYVYKCNVTAINHSVVICGGFDVSTVILKFNVNGQR